MKFYLKDVSSRLFAENTSAFSINLNKDLVTKTFISNNYISYHV